MKRICIDITDPGSQALRTLEAAKASCPNPPKLKIRRVIVRLFLRWNNTDRLRIALLDWGVSIPIQNHIWATRNDASIFKPSQQLTIQSLIGQAETDIGEAHTYPFRPQY
jgi:hypothetical protein